MVLINDKKYACATCIKGHRVSGCTHTERPLFEVKKKGRPSTQCSCCKDRRKSNSVHNKCVCGDGDAPAVILPGGGENSGSSVPGSSGTHSPIPPPSSSSHHDNESLSVDTETRKGVPGSTPTFPNGLRDVHEMSAAVEALSHFSDERMRVAERSVQSLLNPCTCKTNGICKCCAPKRPATDGTASPSPTKNRALSENIRDMFRQTPSVTPPDLSPSLLSPAGSSKNPMTFLSPEDRHHPRHTSPHVHKTKLYSPYSSSPANGRHAKRDSLSKGSAVRAPPSKIRPLADMGTFLGAVFNDDGSVSNSIPRSALGLPGIRTFDTMAEEGGTKVEPMEVDENDAVSFPTREDVVIGACTCGPNCECPGCAIHGNSGHAHEGACGEGCKSSYDCAEHLSLPSGITSIQHLLTLAASNVPKPANLRSGQLDAHDTAISPPAVHLNEEAASLMGYVQLKPLQCCNGRCQCSPGSCSCTKDCCGCCIRCACAEDAADTSMGEESKGDCCGSGKEGTTSVRTAEVSPLLSPVGGLAGIPPIALVPEAQPKGSCCQTSGSTSTLEQPLQPTPPPIPLKRSASTSHSHASSSNSAAFARRATVTASTHSALNRSASSGKSKALALAQHPRAIAPRASGHTSSASMSHLTIPKNASGSGSRTHSPSGRRASASSSRIPSPAPGLGNPPQQPTIQITPTDGDVPHLPSSLAIPSTHPSVSDSLTGFENDQEILDLLEQLNAADANAYSNFPAFTGNISPGSYIPPEPVGQDAYNMVSRALGDQAQPALSIGSQSPHSGPPSRDPIQPQEGFYPQTTNPNFGNGNDYLSRANASFLEEYYRTAAILAAQDHQHQQQPLNLGIPLPRRHSQQTSPQIFPQNPPIPPEQVFQFPPGGFANGFPQDSVYIHGKPAQYVAPPSASSMYAHHQAPPPQLPQPTSSSSNHTRGDSGGISSSNSNGNPSFNPNMIDLSKPLNASDMERIMQALQAQSQSNNETAQRVPPPPQVQAPQVPQPPRIPTPLPPQPPQPTETFDPSQFLDPFVLQTNRPLQTGSSSGTGTIPSAGLDNDDFFSEFVLDNPGEGLDLSALDIGGGGTNSNTNINTNMPTDPGDWSKFTQEMQGQGVGPTDDGVGVEGDFDWGIRDWGGIDTHTQQVMSQNHNRTNGSISR